MRIDRKRNGALLSLAIVVSACNDDGNPIGDDGAIYTGTAGEDDVGDTGGTDGGLGCYPEWDDPGDGDGDPVYYTCEGEGVGWAHVEIYTGFAPIHKYACADSSVSDPSAENCAADKIDFTEIDVLSDSAVPDPTACCLDNANPGDVDYACLRECAYAACKLASVKLREAADALPNDPDAPDWAENNSKADLIWIANEFDADPAALDECAELVIEAAPYIVAYNMGGGPASTITPIGHVEDVDIWLSCDVDVGLATAGGTCEASANTPEDLEPMQSNVVFNDSVSFYGGYGEFVSAVASNSYDVIASSCSPGPCSFSLRAFDLELADLTVGSFVFEDITVSIPGTITGSRTGTAVEFAVGDFDIDVSLKVKVDGSYLYGTVPFEFSVSNTDVVSATWVSNVFEIQEAEFEVGVVTAFLNTEPPT